MSAGARIRDAALAAVPLALSPALLFALAEGWIDLGGGEKDVLLVLPYVVWALVFFLSAVVLVIRRWPLRRWLARAAAIATLALLALGLAAYWTSLLGIA